MSENIVKSIFINNGHENKLIDFNNKSNTTVYSKIQENSLNLTVCHNLFGVSHSEKEDIISFNIDLK